jgi:hypothetical protein
MENKIKRNFNIDYSLDWTYGVEISKIRSDLDALEKLGATHVNIEVETSYDYSYIVANAFAFRTETDSEYKERIDKEREWQEQIKRRDLEQLEILKTKYKQ